MKFLSVLFLFLIISCNNVKESAPKIKTYANTIGNVKLKRVRELKLDEKENSYIGRFYYAKYNRGNIVIADVLKPELFFYDEKNGKLNKKITFKKGRGPGEVIKIGSYEILRDKIFISDMGNFRWEVFDTTGKYIKMARPFSDKGPYQNRFIGNLDIMTSFKNKLYVSIIEAKYNRELEFNKSKAIAILDTALHIQKVFGFMDAIFGKIRMRNTAAFITFDNKGFLYYTQEPIYKVYKYNYEGNFIKSFGVKSDFKMIQKGYPPNPSIPMINKIALTFSHTWALFYTNGYLILEYLNLNKKFYESKNILDREHFIKIYDTEGNYYSPDIKLSGFLITVNNKGELFVLENNEPGNRKIGVFKLVINTN